jgi:hypothetical protein
MSKHIFNGFEGWMLQEALKNYIEQAEAELEAAEKEGKNLIFAPGYFRLTGGELQEKVKGFTVPQK